MEHFSIQPARSVADIAVVADLFRAYAASLPVDLGYQGFEAELAALPGKYAPPGGGMWLARAPDGMLIGCIALRPFPHPGACEMKRLYVLPAARGLGLGAALARTSITAARDAGYTHMLLDTLPSMRGAIALYESAGFERVPAYYDTPIAETLFFRLDLTSDR